MTRKGGAEESKEEEVKEAPHPDPKFKHLNAASVNAMKELGIADDKILTSLTYLKRKVDYTSLGEVDRALQLLGKMKEYEVQN